MNNLNKDLSTGQFHKVYLLYGEEEYLKKQYKDRLKAAIIAPSDTMNYAYYEGEGIDEDEITAVADTMPFFAEKRLIVLKDTGFFKNTPDHLPEYLEKMPDTTCMVFVESNVDKRGKLYKAVVKTGIAAGLWKQDDTTLVRWIVQMAKKGGKKISVDAASYFLSKAGTDMQTIHEEFEKLFCYAMDYEEIKKSDVDAICTAQTSDRIFDMIDAVANKRQKKALYDYYDLLTLKVSPMRILFLLTRQFRMILEVLQLTRQGCGRQEIAGKMGVREFVISKLQHLASHFTEDGLKSILEDGLDTEESIKNGRLAERTGVELFIINHSA